MATGWCQLSVLVLEKPAHAETRRTRREAQSLWERTLSAMPLLDDERKSVQTSLDLQQLELW